MTIFVTTVDKFPGMVYPSGLGVIEMVNLVIINPYSLNRQQPKKELLIPYG